MRPTVRALTIDDVPFLTVTLHAAEPMPAGRAARPGRRGGARGGRRAADRAGGGGGRRAPGGAGRAGSRSAPDALGVSVAELQQALCRPPRPSSRPAPWSTAATASALEARGLRLARRPSCAGWWSAIRDGRPVYVEDVARVMRRARARAGGGPDRLEGAARVRAGRHHRGGQAAGHQRHRAGRRACSPRCRRCGAGSSRPRCRPPSPATTARPRRRSRTSSSSTCSSPRSR